MIFGGIFSLILLLGMLIPINAVHIVQPISVSANDITSHYVYGEVRGSGVYGYTTNYVCNGGAKEVEHAVQNGWHITAKNLTYAYGILWYECWDTDDGDYYGWIDTNYISIYSNNGNSYNDDDDDGGSGSFTATIYSVDNRKGEVAGSSVCSYTTDYVAYGGSKTVVRSSDRLKNGWHITAKNKCSSYGITWYECWDTDDGDYYGWIDSNYLTFYSTATAAPVQTSVVVKTVTVTVTQPAKTVTVTQPAQTVIETVLVTETTEETVTETVTETTDAVAALNFDDNDNNNITSRSSRSSSSTNGGMDNNLLLILIAVAIFLIIIVAVLIILLMARKMQGSRSIGRVQENFDAPQQPQHPSQLFCTNCGASRTSQDGIFCKKCGHRYEN